MYGVASVIELKTGLGVDYNMMSKYCLVCSHNKLDPQSEEYKQWYEDHKKIRWCELQGIHTLPLNFLFCDWFFSKYAEWIENVHCTPRLSAYSLFVISWPLNRHNKSREIPK